MQNDELSRVEPRGDLTAQIAALRPKLHRYCARMIGSVIEGEDVVQDAVERALRSLQTPGPIDNLEGWMFRIAHNVALDYLRRCRLRDHHLAEADIEQIVDERAAADRGDVAAAALATFMHLPVGQRACVILKDVLGYAIAEISHLTGLSTQSVKAALHRGRAQLRATAARAIELRYDAGIDTAERMLLSTYVERFNARDFDTIRGMLADEIRVDLASKACLRGKAKVANYFTGYASQWDWRFAVGCIEGRPAILVFDPADSAQHTTYFLLLQWQGDRVCDIRDFRYARYVMAEAEARLC